MRNIFVIATMTAETSVNTVDAMVARSVMVVGDGKEVITGATTVAQMGGIKNVSFITKTSNGNLRVSVPIPRRQIIDYNIQLYSASQTKQVQLGTGVPVGALIIPSEGEVNFLIKNLSYNHTISTQRYTFSATKTAAETAEAFIDRVVAGLNKTDALQTSSIATAVKLGSGASLGIQWTCATPAIDFYVGVDGILAGTPVKTVREAKVSSGAGPDVVAMEKDLSKHQGNHGYIENTDLWYKQPTEALASENYDIVTLDWKGISPTPTNNIEVARDSFSFAFPLGAAGLTAFQAILALVVGNAYTPTGGSTTADPDTNALDNIDNNLV